VLPARRLYGQLRQPAESGAEQLAATQAYGVIPQSEFMARQGQKVVLALSGTGNFKAVSRDDFVISLRSFQGGIERSYFNGCVSPAYTVLRAKVDVLPEYVAYLLKSGGYISALQSVTTGIREGKTISYEQFATVPLPVPPRAEQESLTCFLDRETARIDNLIAKQKRLIVLLQKKRQALITHAVTQGLDPTAPMKESGVEWLGHVPAHWEVAKLKHVAQVRGGVAKGRNLKGQQTVKLPYLRVANVQDGYFDLTEVVKIEVAISEVDRYRLQKGDVLMNEGGDYDKLGRGDVWSGEIDPCLHQNHVFAVRPLRINPEWLSVLTGSDYAKRFFESRAKKTTNLASISSSNLSELPVVIPSKEEQRELLVKLDRECSSLDALISKAERMVALSQEHRSALISAAVTGKIDVRKAV
jgi:type I restriction enzyme S subunit